MTNKVQKIREDVERLKSQLLRGACSSQVAMETRCKEEAYNEVLAILDTMQEEPVSEDMEEAASIYRLLHSKSSPYKSFKEGAKWVIRQTPKAQKEEYFKEGFKKGKRKLKREILEKAIEGIITFDYYGDGDKTYGYVAHDSFCLEDLGLKDTDKVKIVLIKED